MVSTLEKIRAFVGERLTAAAEEISGFFEGTLSEYEKEIERQRALLDIVWQPKVKRRRREQHLCEDVEVLTLEQKSISRMDQEKAEYLHIKEEPEELSGPLEGEQLVDKQDYDASNQTCDRSEVLPQVLDQREKNPPNAKKRGQSKSKRGPSTCNICKKIFRYKCRLTVHMRIHTGEKPYRCGTCRKAFAQASSLQTHMRVHTGEQPYSCGVCKKRFSKKSNLIMHERIHTGERPFSCGTCRKRFSKKSHLIVHERIHTGEKPYTCRTCGEKFSYKSGLTAHMSGQTQGRRPKLAASV